MGCQDKSGPGKIHEVILVVLGFLVIAAVGIVAGYFIGRNSVKACSTDRNITNKTEKGPDEFHKNAVEMVSTKELRSNLE